MQQAHRKGRRMTREEARDILKKWYNLGNEGLTDEDERLVRDVSTSGIRIMKKNVATAIDLVATDIYEKRKMMKMKMTNAEKEYVAETNRLRKAIKKTNSEYLKADYSKALKRMKRELREYRRFRSGK